MVEEGVNNYYGSASITVRFENRVQWQKWRKYVLKTDWDFDGGSGPYIARLEEKFNCSEDVERITKRIVQLLELGFEVYSCQWKLIPENVQEIRYYDENGNYVKEKIPVEEDDNV